MVTSWNEESKQSLKIYYRFNSKASMTRVIFIEWITELDKNIFRQNKKILLFVDNFQHANKTLIQN